MLDKQGKETQAAKQKDHLKLPDYSHLNVLVAEDNIVNQLVIKNMLKKLNIEAKLVADGSLALDAYTDALKSDSGPIDVIFMDCEMPTMTGYEATQKIRAHERQQNLSSVSIIALTAHVLPEYREQCIACGMNDLMSKPIMFHKIHDQINSIVDNSKFNNH